MNTITAHGTIWLYPGDKASWYFLTLDKAAQKKLETLKGKTRGWGQVGVTATLGNTTWETSVFPDKKLGWGMPIKAQVRKKEGVGEGSKVTIKLELRKY